MNKKKEVFHVFFLTLLLGWFYSGAVWLLLGLTKINDHLEEPWQLLIAVALGHSLTAAQATWVAFEDFD
tara:strand:+ start:346 stop:552 length:207 start_codon:yes stop_codon:yes gene_type:complete